VAAVTVLLVVWAWVAVGVVMPAHALSVKTNMVRRANRILFIFTLMFFVIRFAYPEG
jgi:hypothetical protein